MEMSTAWINSKLGDLDFADDICLLNKIAEDSQTKTDGLASSAKQTGLITKSKMEVIKIN